MSEMKRPSLGDDEANSESPNTRDREQQGSTEIARDPNENHINGTFHGHQLDQGIQERIRDTDGRRSLMSGMPSINLSELTLILRDPRMPSHKVMNKVADKIAMISEESESDDGSMGSTGGFVGFQGVMNCIFDAAIQIVQPGNSDDEDEDLERIPLKYSCNVCNKVFGNNMDSNTHVLVAHQDPSVLNISSLSRNADSKDKTHAHRRRHSKTLPRPEAGATRGQPSRILKDSKETVRSSRGGEGAPSVENRSSESRSRHNEPSEKPRCSRDRVGAASLPTEQTKESEPSSSSSSELSRSVDTDHNTVEATSTEDSTPQSQDLPVTDGGCNLPDGVSQVVATDQTQSPVSGPIDFSSGKSDTRVESSAGGRAESQKSEQNPRAGGRDQAPSSMENNEEDSSMSAAPLSKKCEAGGDAIEGRKRKATSPLSESALSSSPSSSFNPKRSRKHVAAETDPDTPQKHDV